ncbi:unnamed protein product [Protopolystoma xenopodis]|uniref:Uncharacterized protein n=1 Tax=Protopolystoma xenopodis TaxID=117903 RepID=A0A448X0R5_9PLAT|nr:unnamed protein product [Protopolystoma xenopodis]
MPTILDRLSRPTAVSTSSIPVFASVTASSQPIVRMASARPQRVLSRPTGGRPVSGRPSTVDREQVVKTRIVKSLDSKGDTLDAMRLTGSSASEAEASSTVEQVEAVPVQSKSTDHEAQWPPESQLKLTTSDRGELTAWERWILAKEKERRKLVARAQIERASIQNICKSDS